MTGKTESLIAYYQQQQEEAEELLKRIQNGENECIPEYKATLTMIKHLKSIIKKEG